MLSFYGYPIFLVVFVNNQSSLSTYFGGKYLSKQLEIYFVNRSRNSYSQFVWNIYIKIFFILSPFDIYKNYHGLLSLLELSPPPTETPMITTTIPSNVINMFQKVLIYSVHYSSEQLNATHLLFLSIYSLTLTSPANKLPTNLSSPSHIFSGVSSK